MNQSLFTTRYMLGYIQWIKKFQSHCHAVPYLDFINQTIHCTEHIYCIPGVSINQSVSDSQKTAQIYTSTWIIRVLIQIQDRKIFGTDRDPDRTLKRILIQTKMIRICIRIQAKKDLLKNAHIRCFVCFYYIFNYHFSINL